MQPYRLISMVWKKGCKEGLHRAKKRPQKPTKYVCRPIFTLYSISYIPFDTPWGRSPVTVSVWLWDTLEIFLGGLSGGRGGKDGGRLDYFTEPWMPPSNIYCDHYMMTWGNGERVCVRERHRRGAEERQSGYMPAVRDALGVISVSVVEMCLWWVVFHTSEIAPQGWAAGQHADNVRKQ